MMRSMPFIRREGGFTTPAVAVALLLVCALVFVCTRTVSVGSRAGQIQYVADAGALAADNVIAEFVTAGQVVDAALLSLSLLGITAYAASAVAAFIPGGQGAAMEIASAGSKVLRARDSFAESAIKGLNAAQKALPALCALRASQAVQANAEASGVPYVGIALPSPLEGVSVELPNIDRIKEATREIQTREAEIQEKAQRQKDAQERESAAKERGWRADCGNGMSMYERARKLSVISDARNPYYSSPEHWRFSIALERAKAYYAARYSAEPGASASGSPKLVAESVARKQFYAYARSEVSKGYVETSASGSEIPHLVHLARNTEQIRSTWLYTNAIYPVSANDEHSYLHAYRGCPCYAAGTGTGTAALCDIDAGRVERCPRCEFSATTLGRVPSASTSINNGFEYHYRALVDAANDYATAVQEGEQTKQALKQAQDSIGGLLLDAMSSLGGARYSPQPPGRYGCVCVVVAPRSNAPDVPFVQDDAALPARIALSGATLAPDPADDQGTVISEAAHGLLPSNGLGTGILKKLFGAWGSMLNAYSNGTKAVKDGFRKSLGAIPLIGNALSGAAVEAFESALTAASIEPADLSAHKPVLVNSSHILARDHGTTAQIINGLKQAAQSYGAIQQDDLSAFMESLRDMDVVQSLLDEKGLVIARIPLRELDLGANDTAIYLPVPNDLDKRVEELCGSFLEALEQ